MTHPEKQDPSHKQQRSASLKVGYVGDKNSFRLGLVYGLCNSLHDNGRTLCYNWSQSPYASSKGYADAA